MAQMVLKCSNGQKNQLVGKKWADVIFFNPVQDADGNWIISLEEKETLKEEFAWVKTLKEIPYNPVIDEEV